MGSVNCSIIANFILGLAKLAHPAYTIQRWHAVLVAYLINFIAASINIFIPHLLDRISRAILCWNICAFITVLATILAMNDHKQSPSFVFSEFQNFTGWGSAYAGVLGILQSAFGMCCYGQ